jgi:acyl carrier protein
MNTNEQFMNLLMEALGLDDPLDLATELDDIPAWDSLAQLSLAALLDEQMSVNLTAQDFANCKTISDLLNAVKQKIC